MRVLVDRIWPRGMTKEQVRADRWTKEVAPSTVLRKWYGHDLPKWEEFKRRYFLELDAHQEGVRELLDAAGRGRLTLLYSHRDVEFNQAAALKEYLISRL